MSDREARARRAFEAATRGELAGVADARRTLGSDAFAEVWRAALDAAQWHAAPGSVALPRVDTVRMLASRAGDAGAFAAGLACASGVRAAVLAFDRRALADWAALHVEVSEPDPGAEARAWSGVSRAWQSVFDGDAAGAEQHATASIALARASSVSPVVVEGTALRALASGAQARLGPAVSLARVAFRMARTEDLPQWQYLTAIVLARMRRLTGYPHLAVRILRALLHVAPRTWRGWARFELALAGDRDAVGGALETSPPPARGGQLEDLGIHDVTSECVRRLRHALCATDAKELQATVHDVGTAREEWPRAARDDVADAIAAVDPRAGDEGLSAGLDDWRRGRSAAVPAPLLGLSLLDPGADEPRAASYVAVDGDRARRCLALGARVAAASGATLISTGAPRVESSIAALALAGRDGLAASELFRSVYGFEYVPAVHRSVLKVLMHRARSQLRDCAMIVQNEGHVVLVPRRPFVIPDPRSEHPLEPMVLAVIARLERASSSEASAALGVPPRTVQAALQSLVDDGAVVVEREGKHLRYGVEDTSFREPTRW